MVAPIDITTDPVKYSPEKMRQALQNMEGIHSFLSTLQSLKAHYLITNKGTVPAEVITKAADVTANAYSIAAVTGGITE